MSRTPHPYASFDSLTVPGPMNSRSASPRKFRHNRTKAAVDNTIVSNASDHQSGCPKIGERERQLHLSKPTVRRLNRTSLKCQKMTTPRPRSQDRDAFVDCRKRLYRL